MGRTLEIEVTVRHGGGRDNLLSELQFALLTSPVRITAGRYLVTLERLQKEQEQPPSQDGGKPCRT